MRVSKIYSAQVIGMRADIVTIEVDLSNGLHAFSIVGLGDKAVAESKDRISAAIKNSGFVSPKQKNQKVVISLAPADIRKEGTMFDLGMAIGYLSACGEIVFNSEKKIFIGELSLEGNIRRVSGVLAMVRAAKMSGFSEIFLPMKNAPEAALVSGITIYPATSLQEVLHHICGKVTIGAQQQTIVSAKDDYPHDFSSIFGQESAKRALEIAAAGKHNIAMYGPPGTGKTMLAKAFTSILPPLSYEEILEVTEIHSIARVLENEIITTAPMRAPHHTSSYASLVGGGGSLRPGEITLAHRGVLFLDEFPEFDKRVIDALRQPLEDKTITVARAKGTVTYPAHCIFIAAMNPCPCGYAGDEKNAHMNTCVCTDHELIRYRKKISGPIVDRIDLWTGLSKVEYEKFSPLRQSEPSSIVRTRILAARKFHDENMKKSKNPRFIETTLSIHARTALISLSEKFGLSGRAYYRSLNVARTIANLAKSAEIEKEHVFEAFQYRQKYF